MSQETPRLLLGRCPLQFLPFCFDRLASLSHPSVCSPYLQLRRPDGNGTETMNFEAKDDDLDLFPTFQNGEMDARSLDPLDDTDEVVEYSRKLAYAIILDRVKRRVYITRWTHAFFYLTFYKDEAPLEMLSGDQEEEGEEIDEREMLQASDYDDEPLPVDPATEKRFLAWLDRRWNNADDLYRLAVQHCKYMQYSEALKALRRALEIRPECGPTYWLISQVYGKLKRWPEALAASKSHQTTHRHGKELPAESLFMWQGACSFMLSRYSDAIESYKVVTDLKPDHAGAYYGLGQCHTELGNYAEAVAAHEQEIKLRISSNSGAGEKDLTKLTRAYEELGMNYYSDFRWPEAERASGMQ